MCRAQPRERERDVMVGVKLPAFLVLLGAFTLATFSQAAPPVRATVGQVIGRSASLDGTPVTSGTTLFNESMLNTGAEPAAIRLVTGDLVELGAHSSAVFASQAPGRVEVTVKSGTLSYQGGSAKALTAAAPASLGFPQRRSGAAVPEASRHSGVVAVLVAKAEAGGRELVVNDMSRLNPEARTMIRTRDGRIFEVHYLKKVKGQMLVLTKPLQHGFAPEDMVIQGCECDEALGAPGNGVVAVLTRPAPKGEKVLAVTTRAFIDPEAPTLVKRKDGSIQEVHRIDSVAGNSVALKDKLRFPFEPDDILVQGCHVPPIFVVAPVWTPFLKGLAAGGAAGGTTLVVVETIRDDCSDCLEKYGTPAATR